MAALWSRSKKTSEEAVRIMCMRGDSGLDQGGSTGGGEIKLDSGYNLVIKPAVFTFGLDVGFREKKKLR